jgi:hypothetical protein
MPTRKIRMLTNGTAKVIACALEYDPWLAKIILHDFVNHKNRYRDIDIVRFELAASETKRFIEISTIIGKPFQAQRNEKELECMIGCDSVCYEAAYGYSSEEAMSNPAILMPASENIMPSLINLILDKKDKAQICMGFIDSENNTLVVDMTFERKNGIVETTHIVRDVI